MKSSIHDSVGLGGAVQIYRIELADMNAGSTSGTTAQIITVDALNPGDIVDCAGVRIEEKIALTHAAATISVKAGITGDDDRFIANTDLKAANVDQLVPTVAADALPYVNNTAAAVNMLLTVTLATGAMSTMSAGELWLVVPILRKLDRVANRQ